MVIPKFSSEAKEAAWWGLHRSGIEAEMRRRIKQKRLLTVANKGSKRDHMEDLAQRIAAEINKRAAKMTPKKRIKADSETKKIAAQVLRRTSL